MDYYNVTAIAEISAIIGGLIKYLLDRLNERRKNKKERLFKLEEQHKDRPEFVITSMKDYLSRPGICINSQPCDLEVFVAYFDKVNIENGIVSAEYNNDILDKKDWVCRQYTLKNVGKTVVYSVDIISNFKKNTCIFDVKSIDEDIFNNGVINYFECLDRRIAPYESFSLKLCYHKERIQAGSMSAALTIGMEDDNRTNWIQPFFAPENKVYESSRIPYQEYREMRLPDKAMECFNKPYLW